MRAGTTSGTRCGLSEKVPGFTATAVLSPAVGIGGAAGLFSVVYAVLLNPFPNFDADRIVTLGLVLLIVALTAAAIPANRAASIHPADALRID